MTEIDGYPYVSAGPQGQFGDNSDAEEDGGHADPGQDDGVDSRKDGLEGDHIQQLSLGEVAVVEEGEGEDDEASGHHIVECLEVPDLEHDGEEGLPEKESFLGPFLMLIVELYNRLFPGGIGLLQ